MIIRDLLRAVYNANIGHQSNDPSVFIHGTVSGAFSLGSVSISVGAVSQSGSWTMAIVDSSGNSILATNTNPVGTEQGLITRNIPSGTQSIAGNISVVFPAQVTVTGTVSVRDSSGNPALATNVAPIGTEQAWIVRPILSGTQSISGNVLASQSGNWTVRIQDSSGNSLIGTNTNPIGTEQGLIVRNIPSGTQSIQGSITILPSGTQTISGAVRVFDSSGNSALATNATPIGTEQAWIVRQILSGTQTISGNIFIPGTQTISGAVRVFDSSGNSALATNVTPVGTEQSWIVRPILSGTQTISGAVRIFDSSGNSALATNTNPIGTEQGFITRPILSGTMTVQGTVTGLPSGTQTISGAVRVFDSSGNSALATNATPIGTEQGWIVRQILSGTQTIQGSITVIPSGTQTVSGAVRIFDSSGNSVIATNTNPVGTEQAMLVRIAGAQGLDGAAVPTGPVTMGGEARTTDPTAVSNAQLTRLLLDSLGKTVVLPGAINDLHLDGQANWASTGTQTLISAQPTGIRIAVQSLLATCSGSQTLQIILQGGPNNRTFGWAFPGGGFAHQAGGAALYITSASTALTVRADVTSTVNVFVSGYSLGN